MGKNILLEGFLAVFLALAPVSGWAYEGESVSNGGTIVGSVKLKGSALPPKKIQITVDSEVCGKTLKTDPSLIVSAGNVANAVVYLADIKKGKKMEPRKVTLDQTGCEYRPHVLAFPAGSTLEVLNPDGILHNVHSYSKTNAPFNVAQPKFTKSFTVKIEKPEVISVKCDVHAWMSGWLFSADNPYYAVTGARGDFKLTDVTPGTYNLEVWHEVLGRLSQKVTVEPKEEVKVTFELAGK